MIFDLLENSIDIILQKFKIDLNVNSRNAILQIAFKDLQSFAERDPSSKNDMCYILQSYKSYFAVLVYRIAHNIYKSNNRLLARKLSEYAKLKSGIEIHPGTEIGECFVLDHGMGTVIGETAVIGKRCYILQNVILGSAQIANNKGGQRHPVIGDDVEIGSFVKIYGNVKIGNGVKISPGAIIKNDIPEYSRIIVASNYQITQGKEEIYYTGYTNNEERIILFFRGYSLLDFNMIEIYMENEICQDCKIDINSISIKCPSEIDLKDIKIYTNAGKVRIDLKGKGIKEWISQ